MDDLTASLDRLTDVLADWICEAFAADARRHGVMRDRAREFREGELVQAVIRPELAALLKATGEGVERKTAERFRMYRSHPRLGREPLIDEGEAADATINTAVLFAQGSPSPSAFSQIELASIRVRAITAAVGPKCIYPSKEKGGTGRTGPRLRRREITAADVPATVAEALALAAASDRPAENASARLRPLEASALNVAGLVSKLLALAALPNGDQHIITIAGRIVHARSLRGEPQQLPTYDADRGDAADATASASVLPAQVENVGPANVLARPGGVSRAAAAEQTPSKASVVNEPGPSGAPERSVKWSALSKAAKPAPRRLADAVAQQHDAAEAGRR
ncbi:hypothetical protein [Sphingomonas sp. BAUL-RG-20F-R05-02]|uniref:hypothetical protein n=1 Tax=Sphingomonas sp. BAUL-RG-20F-R05-02 TaxID=2914830 RepID=UPI001F596189|nr:hypothetical protein [Sphingomonas sp. BAUL-RG-20F-R05-02]